MIAAVEEQSSLTKFINDRKIGFSITPENLPNVVQCIREKAISGEMILNYRNNAKITYKAYFEEQPVLDKWSEYFRENSP